MRIQEIHPGVVHFPVAFLPLAIALDALGKATGSQRLMDTAALLMPVTVASMAAAGVTGLAAQGAVKAEGRASDILATHRTLNTGLAALTTLMTIVRVGQRRPGAGYLLLGAAAVAAMGYSAYLGGRMVYEHGVGVKPADGVHPELTPEIGMGNIGEAASAAATATTRAVEQTVESTRQGNFVPELRSNG